MPTRPILTLLLMFAACSSNGSSGPPDGAVNPPDASRDGSADAAETASDTAVMLSDTGDASADTAAIPGDTADASADTADMQPAYQVAFESNGNASTGGAIVVRGAAALRLPPQPARRVLAAIHFLTYGDAPPGSFGGGGVSLEISRGLPGATGSTRVARAWLGSCDGQLARPCWTGPRFDPPVVIEAGEQNVFLAIDRLGGEGGSFVLPITSDPAASQKQESWGRGSVSWGAGSSSPQGAEWARAPADQPWIFRLLVAK